MPDEEQFWDEVGAGQPPLSAGRIREWEDREGIRLPPVLASALMIQNGGCVRGTEGLLWVNPLTRFESLDQPQWEYLWEYQGNQEFGDPGRIFIVGAHEAIRLLLDYNVGEEPRVLWFDEDQLYAEEKSQTFDELIQLLREPED